MGMYLPYSDSLHFLLQPQRWHCIRHLSETLLVLSIKENYPKIIKSQPTVTVEPVFLTSGIIQSENFNRHELHLSILPEP